MEVGNKARVICPRIPQLNNQPVIVGRIEQIDGKDFAVVVYEDESKRKRLAHTYGTLYTTEELSFSN